MTKLKQLNNLFECSMLSKYRKRASVCECVQMSFQVVCDKRYDCNGPKILIAEEPTTALDVTVQAQIMTLLNEL